MGLGEIVLSFALPEANFFYFMFSDLSMLAIIIVHVIKTICQSKKQRGSAPPAPLVLTALLERVASNLRLDIASITFFNWPGV